MIKCEICNNIFTTSNRLCRHIERDHNVDRKIYYDKYIRKDNEGICPICGKDTFFIGFKRGYRTYCSCSCSKLDPIIQQHTKQTNLATYGVEVIFQRPDVIEKAHSKEAIEKAQQTMYKKFGVKSNLERQEVRDKCNLEESKLKAQETLFKHFGVKNPVYLADNNSEEAKKKRAQTTLDRFGVDNIFKLPEVREKAIQESTKPEVIQQRKTTMKDIYGYETTFENPEILDKLWNEETTKKRNETRKKNSSYNKSVQENKIYNLLLTVYSKDDIIRQYKSKEYPFNCDFYIKSLDLYIECNFHWTHGDHWFDKNNIDDINTLNIWLIKAKNSKYYENAIYNWTIRDVKKLEALKSNNLKYLILWNFKDSFNYIQNLLEKEGGIKNATL